MRVLFTVVVFSTVSLISGLGYENLHGPNKIGVHEDSRCLTRKPHCDSRRPFPTFDGTCNNLKHPTWGATNTPLQRLLPADYADSVSEPRSNGAFGKLPLPRSISNALQKSEKIISEEVSHMHALFGQLIVHDIALTPIVKNKDGSELDCNCYNPYKECINIKIPDGDIQQVKANRKCMSLARSEAAIGINKCKFPLREQINSLSIVADMTFIYGKTDQESRDLRDSSSYAGELKTVSNPASKIHKNLPNQDQIKNKAISKTMDCPVKIHTPLDIPCFVAGDVRSNENPGLASIITTMARYHNYVARNLNLLNKEWNSDEVFNVARRIVIAIYQSIIYREYVPLLLGPVWTKRFDLELTNGYDYWNGYDPRYNPAIGNEFTTAAFRYGHSQVTANMTRPNSFFRREIIPNVPTAGTFFTNDNQLEKDGGGAGAILRGFSIDNAEKTDTTVVDALRNQLFTEIGDDFGKDLLSINIQRGRDHGLPGYNKYRELCGLEKVQKFSDLSNEMSSEVIKNLRHVYHSVDDIDLFVGGLAEKHIEGGQVGPTFACILGYGFRSLRRGDRYWHENENSPSPFTNEQLAAIRKTTFASILCQVGEDMKFVKKFPMSMTRGKSGTTVSCDSVSGLDIYPWRAFGYHSKMSHDNVIWTTWFLTKHTQEKQIDIRKEALRIFEERPEETCSNRLGFETREVSKSSTIQIRFACRPGTISYTDFPFQLDEYHYWSNWITADSSHSGVQKIELYEFKCTEHIVALQAMSGKKYASETKDVFEEFGAWTGFTCRDKDQLNGKCHRYRVRALCNGQQKVSKENKTSQTSHLYPDPTSKAPLPLHFEQDKPTSGHLYPDPTPNVIVPTLYPEDPPDKLTTTKDHYPKPPTTKRSIPQEALRIANLYCDTYNVCCIPQRSYDVKSFLSFPVLTYAANLCRKYEICCNP